jgi:allantoinase
MTFWYNWRRLACDATDFQAVDEPPQGLGVRLPSGAFHVSALSTSPGYECVASFRNSKAPEGRRTPRRYRDQLNVNTFDVIIRGASVVNSDCIAISDIGITDEAIVAVGPALEGAANETLDAVGLHVFPGLIDSHVHFNDPGRAHWEGIGTGSRALAAGGGTMFFDMPLNAHPPTTDAGSFDKKVTAAKASSHTDFAFWGGLIPNNLDRLEELSERGVIGFKAFMANSGIEDFPCVDDRALRAGMKKAAQLEQIVAVHAESEKTTSELTREFLANGKTTVRDYLDSRPISAELDAIERALEMAGETGCDLHIVHVSCGAGIALVVSAQKLGIKATCETCPHYLALTEDDMERIGALAKCAPPLRARSAQDGLWKYLKTGAIATIGSDHSPAPPDMKTDANFFKVWGGISGVQHTLPLLVTEGHIKRELALPLIARLTSFDVAERFKLPTTKGRIAVGVDADLTLVDLSKSFEITAGDLLYRHRQSPYCGRALTGKVVQTILRGQIIYKNGKIAGKPGGKLVKPVR